METLRVLVQNLIIIVVLAVLLEMLMPSGDMRRYTKMVLGLMVIIAVIQAVSGITGGGLFREMEEYSWRSLPGKEKNADVLGQGRKLEEESRRKALEQYKSGVAKQITALVEAEGKVRLTEAKINVEDDPSRKDFGRIKEIDLVLGREGMLKPVDPVVVSVGGRTPGNSAAAGPPPEYAEAAEKAARIVTGFYNLSREQVKVSFSPNF